MNVENFSEQTIELLRTAHKKASILKFDDVGTDHLLLALTEEIDLFERMGLNPWLIHREVSVLLGEGEATESPSNYTPRAKQVIDRASIEMEKLKQPVISPGIMFLSLLSEQGGVAIRALNNLNVDLNALKDKLAIELKDEKTYS